MVHLDKNQARARGRPSDLGALWTTTAGTDGDSPVARRALVHAIYAYSVRWLHLAHDDKDQDEETRHRFAARKQELSENLWAQARRHMYAVLSRPSYQSLLALYLFAIIPTAAHMRGDDLADQCLEASLSHQISLTSIVQPSISQQDSVIRLLNPAICPDVDMDISGIDKPLMSDSEEVKSMASVVYWFSIISDTTRTLTRCRPSLLLPGGSGDAKVWAHVRQRAQEFQQRYSSLKIYRWRTPFSDDQVLTILQSAFAMKTSVWAAITRVQDALVYQLSGISLVDAVDAARKESNRFEEVFGQLLCMCQRDFLLLNRNTQMCYSKFRISLGTSPIYGINRPIALLQIHFQVGNLILADTLPLTFVFIDENLNPYDLRLCATRAIIIAVNLALQTSMVGANGKSTMMNVLVLDPYPDILTNAIVRTGSSLFLLYNAQKLTTENVMTMFPVVISALKVLADLSYTASEAIPLLQQKFAASGIDQAAFFETDILHQAAVSVAAPLGQEVFDAEVLRELEKNAATSAFKVNNPGERDVAPRTDQEYDSFDQSDFDFLSQDWTFDVSTRKEFRSCRIKSLMNVRIVSQHSTRAEFEATVDPVTLSRLGLKTFGYC